jgi:hypothetical protein
VFLARSVSNGGQLDAARGHLEDTDEADLDDAGRFDFAISWALLAAKSLSPADIENAKAKMKAVEAKDPVFIQLRDRWTIDLMELKSTAEPGKIRRMIRRLNACIILNPNFFGLGIKGSGTKVLLGVVEDQNAAVVERDLFGLPGRTLVVALGLRAGGVPFLLVSRIPHVLLPPLRHRSTIGNPPDLYKSPPLPD